MAKPRVVLLVTLLLICCAAEAGLTGCTNRRVAENGTLDSSDQSRWPKLGTPTMIEPGVLLHEANLTRGANSISVWVYLPESHARSIPAVLIAPAGSSLLFGMTLGLSDRPEHLPYVRAGFAVIAYEIEGDVPEDSSWNQAIAGSKAFESAGYGVADARLALDFALARVPEIDGAKIVSAGHSSAATLSLLVAASDPRIKGCIAYAPVCDVGRHLRPELIEGFSTRFPDARTFLENSSPVNHIATLRCPVFLFHSEYDTVVSKSEVTDFADLLKKSNQNVTLMKVDRGDHYNSMIKEGIPAGISWAQSLPGFADAPKP